MIRGLTALSLAIAAVVSGPDAMADFYCMTVRDRFINTTNCSQDREHCEIARQSLDDDAYDVGRCVRVTRAFCFSFDTNDDTVPMCHATALQCVTRRNATRQANRVRHQYSNITTCTQETVHPDAQPEPAPEEPAWAVPTPPHAPASTPPTDAGLRYFCEPTNYCHASAVECSSARECVATARVYCVMEAGVPHCFATDNACANFAIGINADSPPACHVAGR